MVTYDDLTDEQQHAVDALDQNVTLTAGAGTGKTTTLTARYLNMIEESLEENQSGEDDEPLSPHNILTTTFTKRGANDLESSIREEITERIADLDVEEFNDWRRVADDLEEGYIHTLHGFCSRLLREHALTIDEVDPGFDTLDENETKALIRDTVRDVLEDYENHEATQTLARRFSRSQLQDVLVDLLGERPESLEWANRWADASEEEYISFVESVLHPIDAEVAAERLSHPDFVDSVATLTAIVEDPPDIDTGGSSWKRAETVVEILDEEFDDGVPTRAKQTMISELGFALTTGGDRYQSYTGVKSRWNDHPQKEEFDTAFETLTEILQPEEFTVSADLESEANSFPFVQALATLTQIAGRDYEARKDDQNVVDYSDQISYTVDFLSRDENTEIREQLRDQLEYVMVDEFQDTDPRQWDIIKLLTAGDGQTFDAQNVFVVGDVKQSIYRFRNADVTQFRETAATLEQASQEENTIDNDDGADDDQLSTNFRTLPTVLESINELFESIFDEDGEPYEAAPQSLSAARDDPASLGSFEYLAVPTDPGFRSRRFDHYEDFAEAAPAHDTELEAMALAARISQVLDEPYQVYPESDEEEFEESLVDQTERTSEKSDNTPPEPRDIRPDDIAILIRSRTHLKKYERALENVDIPYTVASGIGFYETTEITALLNLFRTLADPSDERALYATLRSPLFGLTDDTIARLKLHGRLLWKALTDSDHEALQEAAEYLQEWRQMAGVTGDEQTGFDGTWAAFLTQILEDTGYLVSISADERPQQARANVEKFREQLREWGDDGLRSLTTLVNHIERRIDLGGRESEASTTGEGVQILTIHDAKGMEFPFVVVPGIDRDFTDNASIATMVEFEQAGDQHAVGMKAPSPEDLLEMEDTIAREALRDRRRAEERAEEKRVLYVACTRARDHLLLSGLHAPASKVEEPTMTDLAAPDPESPSNWRDMVQPELFTEDLCATLNDENSVQCSYGDGAYTLSLPTPPVEQVNEGMEDTPTVELSPVPEQPEIRFQLSATALASLQAGYSRLEFDENSRTYYAEKIEEGEETPSDRHGEELSVVSEDESRAQSEAESEDTEVEPTVFGEMVHRLCELRPPEQHWSALMEQTLVDEDSEVEQVTEDLYNRVCRHAERGIGYVDSQTTGIDVEGQYDELYVTAEFERGEISGYIDHLIVTPDVYQIIDYKTGAVSSADVEADATYYQNQMKAYAVALYQQRTDRAVRVSLVFTAIDEIWEIEWATDQMQNIESTIQDELEVVCPS